LAPSVSALQQLLLICERQLQLSDLAVNVRKSACMRFGLRYKVKCKNIIRTEDHEITWSGTVTYLGIYFTSSMYRPIHARLATQKSSSYTAFDAIFGDGHETLKPETETRRL